MWKETPKGIQVPVKIIPMANKSQVVGWENEELKIRVSAVPEKEGANKALVRFLSKQLKISKSQITITHGLHSRHKKLLISGVTSDHLQRHLF